MKQHLHRMAGLCLAVTLLLTAAGCGQQGGKESTTPTPGGETTGVV